MVEERYRNTSMVENENPLLFIGGAIQPRNREGR
jgi:hypothetical protein